MRNLFPKLLTIILNYIRFLPLTYFFAYFMVSISVLVIDTRYEKTFVQLVRISLGINSYDFVLQLNDVSKLFVLWWFVTGTIFQLISRFLKIEISRLKWFVIFTAGLLFPTLLLILKTNSIIVPSIFYLIAIVSLASYHALAIVLDKLTTVLLRDQI